MIAPPGPEARRELMRPEEVVASWVADSQPPPAISPLAQTVQGPEIWASERTLEEDRMTQTKWRESTWQQVASSSPG